MRAGVARRLVRIAPGQRVGGDLAAVEVHAGGRREIKKMAKSRPSDRGVPLVRSAGIPGSCDC
jgi:hypothetical protein